MSSTSLGMNDFLGHETRSGGGSNFFRGWRKRPAAAALVWLHRQSAIIALWQHGIPRIYEKTLDDGTKQLRVFGGSWNCLESEEVLKKQYKRDRNTGDRILPPVVCPVCRLMEHLRSLYKAGEVGFTEELFKWEGDDPQETQVLTYGGMLNLYGAEKYLTAEEKAEMKSARVRPSEAWKENVYAKCNYAFTIVDADNPADGVQIAVETTSLGDHVKECIRNQMVSLGEEEGNPILKPYALRWEHLKNATEFNKKYKCIAMPRTPLTPDIEELINSEPPDLSGVTRPGNITTLRADLEAHYIGSATIDWDHVFGPAERAGFGQDQDEEEVAEPDEEPESEAAPEPKSPAPKKPTPPKKKASRKKAVELEAEAAPEPAAAPVKKTRRKKKAEPPPPPPPAADEEPCEECGFMLGPDVMVCPQCGAEFEPDDEPEAAPAPAPAQPVAVGAKKGIKF